MTEAKKARVYDKDWRYTKSESTDLRALFKRIRREQKEAEAAAKAKPAKPVPTIHAERRLGAK